MARVDYTAGAAAYRAARTLPADVLAVWQHAIAQLDLPRPQRVLDMGAGPGGFLDPLAEWLDAPIVAVEPSAAMRDTARREGIHERHPYVAAWAEHLPMREASIDVAWLSTVIHQFDDRDAVARELRRVVRPNGRVLVRGLCADVAVTGLLASFPGIDRAAATFPSTNDVVTCFEAAGFTVDRVQDVVEPWRFDVATWADRIASMRHVDSAFRPLTDAEFAAGVRTVLDAHPDATVPIASDTTLRLIVLAG